MTDRPMIEWTRPKLEQFRKAYNEAKAKNAETFMFNDYVFLTSYGKYLIEYLDGVLFTPKNGRAGR